MSNSNEGNQYLGKGVNIFTYKYLQIPQQGQAINPDGLIINTPIRKTEILETYGSSFAEFIKNVAIKAGVKGSYGGFSGSVESEWSKDSLQSTTTKFLKLSTTVSGNMLNIGEDKTVLKRHLEPDFLAALENDDPITLFEAYGTHVVVKAKIGGMAEYDCHSKESTEVTETQFKLAAKAKYKSLGGSIEGSTGLTTSEKETQKNIEGGTGLRVHGGNASARQLLEVGKKGSWESWAGTIAESPAFLGFPVDGLLPIWDLVDDTSQRQALQLAFKQLAAKHFTVRIFSFTSSSSSLPDAQVRVPDDYKLLSGGAKDNWTGEGNLLTASFPEGDNTWRALGKDHSLVSNATMTVYALAVCDPDDNWEVKIFKTTGTKAADPCAEVPVEQGFVLVGGGAQVNWTGSGNLLTASYPKDSKAWAAKSKDQLESSPATITAYAIGLKSKVAGVKIETSIEHSTSPNAAHPNVYTQVGSKSVMVGGGAQVNWTGSGNLLTASYPKDSKAWAAKSKDHSESSPATITAYTIGLGIELESNT